MIASRPVTYNSFYNLPEARHHSTPAALGQPIQQSSPFQLPLPLRTMPHTADTMTQAVRSIVWSTLVIVWPMLKEVRGQQRDLFDAVSPCVKTIYNKSIWFIQASWSTYGGVTIAENNAYVNEPYILSKNKKKEDAYVLSHG